MSEASSYSVDAQSYPNQYMPPTKKMTKDDDSFSLSIDFSDNTTNFSSTSMDTSMDSFNSFNSTFFSTFSLSESTISDNEEATKPPRKERARDKM